VQAALWSPKRLKIEKHGDYFTMWLAGDDGQFRFAGSSPRIALAKTSMSASACAATKKISSKRPSFPMYRFPARPPRTGKTQALQRSRSDYPGFRRPHRRLSNRSRIEAPNWTRDGASLLFNRNGKLKKFRCRR